MARIYTEASGFVLTLRNFLARIERLDEIALNVQKAQLLRDQTSVNLLSQEYHTLQQSQLAFWVEVRRQHRRVTGELFQELRSILEGYA